MIDNDYTINLHMVVAMEDTLHFREIIGNVAKRGLPFKTVGLRRMAGGRKMILPQYSAYHDIEVDQTYFKMVDDKRIINTKPITFPENTGIHIAGMDYVLISNAGGSLQIRCQVTPSPILIHPETVVHIATNSIIIDLFQ